MPKNDDGPQNGGAVEQPDFEKAARILKRDVKPAEEKVGEHAQMISTAIKAIAKECHVNTKAARLVFWLSKQSDEKADDFLRSFTGMCEAMDVGLTTDLVDAAEGKEAPAIVPTKQAKPLELATLN